MWRWEADTGPLERTFETQGDAETWLAENYEDLIDLNIENVTLWEGDRVVYGPMSLHPA